MYARPTEELFDLVGRDQEIDFFTGRQYPGQLTSNGANLLLQLTDTSLPGVLADKGQDRLIRQYDVGIGQTRLF